jgi:two-component system, OmpR family, phosphate regulon sensor histidine kinase PhoR
MKNRHLRKIIIIGTVLLICLLIVQVYWFSRAFDVTERQFDHSVQIALKKVADSLARDASVKKLSSNFFFANTEAQLNEMELDSLIRKELSIRNLDLEYELGVYDASDDTLVYGILVPSTRHQDDSVASQYILASQNKNFAIYFPGKRSYIAAQLDIWIFSTIILLTMFGFFAYAIVQLLNERKFSELKDDFISNMTHEFKTPVTNIGIAAEVLKNKINPEAKLYVDILLRENEKLRHKIEEVLYGASETYLQTQNFQSVDVHQLVKDCAEAFELKVQQRDGTLTVQCDATRSVILGDRHLLSQAISNVIDNAEKYSRRKPSIYLQTRDTPKGIEISVIDNGVGIPAVYRERIFDKFFRVPTGDVHNVKGFGLGLNFVKQVIEAHRGNLLLSTEVEEGTEIKILLPVA